MGLTKRKDGWYVEFPVIDDGQVLQLARGTPGAKLKRWKTLTPNKTLAKQQEAKIKTDLMMGRITNGENGQTKTFHSLTTQYLQRADIQRQSSYSWKQTVIRNRFYLSSEPTYSVGLPLPILRPIGTSADWHQVFKEPVSKCRV